MAYVFSDANGDEVRLEFGNSAQEKNGKHVWILCRYQEKWLLTKHKTRGLEFPGGKVEPGETPREAAVREIMEETGATVKTMKYVGQYIVYTKEEPIVKNIYFAEIEDILDTRNYHETDGPALIDDSLRPESIRKDFSFIMKDEVLQKSLDYLLERLC